MQYVLLTIFLLFVCCDFVRSNTSVSDQCPNLKEPSSLIRKRRYLVFGTGSSFVMTVQLVKAWVFRVPSGWNLALEIDVMFPLPDEKFSASMRRKVHHRQKREFWNRLEESLNFHNLNGRTCILRGICEAREHLAPVGRSLVHDILRAIFTAPLHEAEFREEMKNNYDEVFEPNFCDKLNDCPLSILSFILALNKHTKY